MDQLRISLLDLIRELDRSNITLTIGGGFGLFLKRSHIERQGTPTLFTELPEQRATNDLDLFLRAELLADLAKTTLVAEAIKRLNYEAIKGAEYLQWKRPVSVNGVPQEIKIDLLVGPLGAHKSNMKADDRRARPKGSIQLHAHPTEEALYIDEQPITIEVEGQTSDGSTYKGKIGVPEAFPYLMMKLHAFNDRKDDTLKDLGRHHALDIYTIVGIMTETEFERSKQLALASASNTHFQKAKQAVREDFATTSSLGVLRLREHSLYMPTFQLQEFIETLAEIFGAPQTGP